MANRTILRALVLVVFARWHHFSRGQTMAPPSFPCVHVTSPVNKLICSTPRLAQLDQELAVVFDNMQGQPIDHKKLRTDEYAWIATLQRDCSDIACIEAHYRARLHVLQHESLQVASPASYEETRPFPVPADLLAMVADRIGKRCGSGAGLIDASIPGFHRENRFQPILGDGFVVVVRQGGSHKFAFLPTSAQNKPQCWVRDAAALPSGVSSSSFLQCSSDDPQTSGFGVRDLSHGNLIAFWAVRKGQATFARVPIKILGIEKSVRCSQPEGPD